MSCTFTIQAHDDGTLTVFCANNKGEVFTAKTLRVESDGSSWLLLKSGATEEVTHWLGIFQGKDKPVICNEWAS